MAKGKGNNTAKKVKHTPRADGLRRVKILKHGRKLRLAWVDKEGNEVAA